MFLLIFEGVAPKLRIRAEVAEQSHFDIRSTEIIQELFFPGRLDITSSFQFDQNFPVNEQVRSKFTDLLTVEPHWNRNLSLEKDVVFCKNNRECLLVNGFQETVPEFVVGSEEDSNQLLGQFPMF